MRWPPGVGSAHWQCFLTRRTCWTSTWAAICSISVRSCSRAPFLLVLAGTPNLPTHLNRMDTSFWSRAEQLGVGRLTEEASRDALLIPLAKHRVTVAPEVLAPVLAESQGYPFFLQLWGAALWRQLQASGATTLTPAHVAAARPDFDRRRAVYHETRFRELETRELVSVAAAFANRSELPDATLRAALGAAVLDATGALRVQTGLDAPADLGYIWRPPTARDWTPGIPSLMGYVQAATGPPLPSGAHERTCRAERQRLQVRECVSPSDQPLHLVVDLSIENPAQDRGHQVANLEVQRIDSPACAAEVRSQQPSVLRHDLEPTSVDQR